MAKRTADILIAGGGTVGMTLALALKRSDGELEVAVVERSARPGAADGRASAIAAAAKGMLETLGVWPGVADVAQPINEMIVTDSRGDDVVRPVFLTFAGDLDDGEPFAHMVPNGALTAALRDTAFEAGVGFVQPDSVAGFTAGDRLVMAELASGDVAEASVLVAADGVRSRLRELAEIRTVGWDYPQTGLVATVAHERPHEGRAEEHFLPSGPFAVLPLRGNRSSLVWTEPKAEAERLLKAETPTLNAEIVKRIGHHLGTVEIEGRLQAHPLGLRVARDMVKPRFCLLGDAAHVIHPLAGQGLNLGLRDAAALAETIVEARRLGLDIGNIDVLERYQAWRRFDTMEMGALTDGLNRLFSNDNPALRLIRDVGLGLVDRMPFLKRMMIDQAAGRGGETPRLLRGEAI
jgi:2-octaprenyl-6-methoxyphenol hydroxylase